MFGAIGLDNRQTDIPRIQQIQPEHILRISKTAALQISKMLPVLGQGFTPLQIRESEDVL
jgi:hypothetical protein